jgi:hypothetical protein
VGKRGEFLYFTPDGGEVWLCGRGLCQDVFNDAGEAPSVAGDHGCAGGDPA